MKNLKITVNGITYDVQVEEVEIQDRNSDNNKNMQKSNTNVDNSQNSFIDSQQIESTTNLCSIKAPMPGTIVSINIKENQKVSKGDVLLILEAMKMENEIMSPENIEILKINVKKGDSVEAGQELILYR